MPETLDRSPDDEDLVRAFQGGDEASFDTLVRRHREVVYRVAWRLTGSHAEADDLAQEAFLRAYRSLGGFRGESTFRTWIVRIVINLALTSRQSRRSSVPVEDVPSLHVGGPGADHAVLRAEIRAAVDRLPRRQRQVLCLKVYEGMKFVEIAAAAGMSVGTAKATFFQAVRGLRARLGIDIPERGREGVGA